MPRFDLANYVTVDERITKFWAMYDLREGSIQTEVIWVREDGNAVAIRASVYVDDHLVATGIAHEERGTNASAGANFSSWWENAETSAIGRALANMDMSLAKNRPSRQEMAKVQRYEDNAPAPRPTPAQRPQDAPNAPETVTPLQERTIAEAWDMATEAQPYPDIVSHLRPLQADATPDQWTAIKRALAAIKATHYTPKEA